MIDIWPGIASAPYFLPQWPPRWIPPNTLLRRNSKPMVAGPHILLGQKTQQPPAYSSTTVLNLTRMRRFLRPVVATRDGDNDWPIWTSHLTMTWPKILLRLCEPNFASTLNEKP